MIGDSNKGNIIFKRLAFIPELMLSVLLICLVIGKYNFI